MDWLALYLQYEASLEDFWGRRNNRPVHSRAFTIFGRPVHLASNRQSLLAAVDTVQPLYSVAPTIDASPFTIQIIARPAPVASAPLPDNLADHIQYAGSGDWLTIQLGLWGHCQVDLAGKRALAVLAPDLAEQPVLVSRVLLNTILTNFLIASGYGFLHTTALLRSEKVLLLLAAHNSGKSTVALRLALSGYQLLSDSMIFVDSQRSAIQLYSFPVGRIKLRADMVADFPQVHPLLEKEPVRGEVKYAADLRRLDPALVHESAVEPAEIYLCLLSRNDGPATRLRPATIAEVTAAVMANSLFYDKAEVWQQNLASVEPLLERASCYHLSFGGDPAGIVATIDQLWHL